jgi:hypothetical protein
MEDGVDHINIYSKGQTELGRYLSNFTYSPFSHPYDGNFNSIEGYWYYSLTGDDRLRHKWGYDAKKYGQSLQDIHFNDEWNVDKNSVKLAIICKLTQTHSNYLASFIQSTLPFRHYYNFGGKIVEPKEGVWLVEFFEELRKLFKP